VADNLENQFSSDDGTQSGGNFFQLSWIGLHSTQWGRCALSNGRCCSAPRTRKRTSCDLPARMAWRT